MQSTEKYYPQSHSFGGVECKKKFFPGKETLELRIMHTIENTPI